MVDIQTRILQSKQLVEDFYHLDTTDEIKITWGPSSDQFATSDPLNRVMIKSNRIVLKEKVDGDTIWHIDIVRGMINYYLPSILLNTWSGWNISTLIALSLLPSTQVTDSQKSRFRKKWVEANKKTVKYQEKISYERFNYERWYKILSNFPRTRVEALFQTFISLFYKYDGSDSKDVIPENILNQFMQNLRQNFSNMTEIDIVATAVKYQTVDVKYLHSKLNPVSETTIYRNLGNLIFQLGEFFMFIPKQIGLTSIYVTKSTNLFIHKIREFPYVENFESFKSNNNHLIKCWVPIESIDDLLNFFKAKLRNDHSKSDIEIKSSKIYRRYFGNSKFRINPYLYDVDHQEWKSVTSSKGQKMANQTVEVTIPNVELNEKITADELRIVKGMLLSRTDDYRKLSVERSQSQTKRLIKKVRRKHLIVPMVFYRKPALPTVLIILPLGDWKQYNRNESVCFNASESNLYRTIIQKPWPYISIEFCQEYQFIQDKIQARNVVFLRISAIQEDFEWLSSICPIYGIYGTPTGTNPNFDVNQFHNGKWKFNTEEMIELILH